ncbi:MAG TPA: SGNH/GDSL hydrolase family protein [Candidatus Tumulicola sp.]|jgi:lysophospholipase L1-like esterase
MMNHANARQILALTALAAITACSSASGTSPSLPATTSQIRPTAVNPVLANIVGVGDSLTAGYQSDGMLGEEFPNPLQPGQPVFPTQENGYWALVDEQASGLPISDAIAREYDGATSPLPLIKAPGINDQIIPANQPPGFNMFKADQCTYDDNFNADGYLLQQSARVRINPTSSKIRDLAVPGISLHEANTLSEPQSSTCKPLPGILGLLATVVDQESSTFWPALRNFSGMGQGLSETAAAAKLKPSLAIVWLGANDVLKYMGSGGRFVGGDNTVGQVSGDLKQTYSTLARSGAKVVTANLPNILRTPYFMNVTVPSTTEQQNKVCPGFAPGAQTYLFCVWGKVAGDIPTGVRITHEIAAQYHLATPNGCTPGSTTKPCGYLTLQGTFTALQYWQDHNFKGLPDLDNGVPGSGLGMYYITPAFAAKVQTLNNTINQGIGEAATSSHVPMVDVTAFFDGVASGDKSNPYYERAYNIVPGTCCGLAYASGLVSLDGLHPSNTGYALLASYFIDKINSSFGTKITQVNVKEVYNGTRCTNIKQCYPDPYAPPHFIL